MKRFSLIELFKQSLEDGEYEASDEKLALLINMCSNWKTKELMILFADFAHEIGYEEGSQNETTI